MSERKYLILLLGCDNVVSMPIGFTDSKHIAKQMVADMLNIDSIESIRVHNPTYKLACTKHESVRLYRLNEHQWDNLYPLDDKPDNCYYIVGIFLYKEKSVNISQLIKEQYIKEKDGVDHTKLVKKNKKK